MYSYIVHGLEGLGGLGLGCEWLACRDIVWEGLGCVGFIYKKVEIMAASRSHLS